MSHSGLGAAKDAVAAHDWAQKAAVQGQQGARCFLDAGIIRAPGSARPGVLENAAALTIAASTPCREWGTGVRISLEVKVRIGASHR